MLKTRINDDLKSAMLAKDEHKLSTIRMLKSAIQYFEIQKGGAGYEATDEDVLEVLGREVKKRRESIDLYQKGGRQELADKEQKEVVMLQEYLPEQLSKDEIRAIVLKAKTDTGASQINDMGRLMGAVMPHVKGKADGNLVSQIVRETLS